MRILGAKFRWSLLCVAMLTPRLMAVSAKDSCVDCHAKLEGKLKVVAAQSPTNVHGQKGMSCTTCHAGKAEAESKERAHSAGFRGSISRAQVTDLCGTCHADGERIKM